VAYATGHQALAAAGAYTTASLDGAIDDASVAPLVAALGHPLEAFYLRIDSPGGSVSAGLELVTAMRAAQRRGTIIWCSVDGWAASMAAYVLQACNVRVMTKQSAIMFHTVSVPLTRGGNRWDFERLAQQLADANKMMAIFIAGRLNITLATYEANTRDRDWWVGYEEALVVGAVDEAY
jgi:ATP-dependent protease ClpP protease subunit